MLLHAHFVILLVIEMKQRRVAASVGVTLFTLVGIVTSNHCSNSDGNIYELCMAASE